MSYNKNQALFTETYRNKYNQAMNYCLKFPVNLFLANQETLI